MSPTDIFRARRRIWVTPGNPAQVFPVLKNILMSLSYRETNIAIRLD